MPTHPDLESLLSAPREALTVEHKSWLDLSTQHGRATLAKAMIAMANHGGGTVVIGTAQSGATFRPEPRPADIGPYTPDGIAAIVKRFADPAFEVSVDLVTDPGSAVELAVIGVPGGLRDIVLCKSGTNDGTIEVAVPYMRKPGPESAAPRTVAEWRILLDRCVQARRAEMLDAIRAIVLGGAPEGPPAPDEGSLQAAFVATSRARWEALASSLPKDTFARLPPGRLSIALRFAGGPAVAPLLTELRDRVVDLAQAPNFGWPPFGGSRSRIEVWEDGIESFLPERLDYLVKRVEYWRVTQNGHAYLLQGLVEDLRPARDVPSGTGFDILATPFRLAEILLWAERFARAGGFGSVALEVRVEGLAGRRLVSRWNPRREIDGDFVCRQDGWEGRTTFDPTTARDLLPEIVHALVAPLYQRFSFFVLPLWLVADETARLRTGPSLPPARDSLAIG